MTLCASIMSRTRGLWLCGVSGTDVGVSASHNKRVLHLACTGHKRSESRCNPCASSALAPTDMFTCPSEESALLCNPNISTQCGILVLISVSRQSKVLFASLRRGLCIYRYVWTQAEVVVRHGLFSDVCRRYHRRHNVVFSEQDFRVIQSLESSSYCRSTSDLPRRYLAL
jgi:hypothetical protein